MNATPPPSWRQTLTFTTCADNQLASSFCERAFWCFVVHSDVNRPQFFAPLYVGHFGRVVTSLLICREKKKKKREDMKVRRWSSIVKDHRQVSPCLIQFCSSRTALCNFGFDAPCLLDGGLCFVWVRKWCTRAGQIWCSINENSDGLRHSCFVNFVSCHSCNNARIWMTMQRIFLHVPCSDAVKECHWPACLRKHVRS